MRFRSNTSLRGVALLVAGIAAAVWYFQPFGQTENYLLVGALAVIVVLSNVEV